MKKFSFKLDGLLKIRKAYASQTRAELAEVEMHCQEQVSRIEDASHKMTEWTQYYMNVMQNGGHAVELEIVDRHIGRLNRYHAQLLVSLDVLKQKKQDLLQVYVERMKDVKILEHLKSQKRNEYCDELVRWDSKESDELALMRRYSQETI